jgi:hypothetical protein
MKSRKCSKSPMRMQESIQVFSTPMRRKLTAKLLLRADQVMKYRKSMKSLKSH